MATSRPRYDARRNWSIVGLPATGPSRELKTKLALFGQFIGDWEIVEQRFPGSPKTEVIRSGEVHFDWILGGRAIQDVWGPVDEKGSLVPVGTTIRYFDDGLGAWRSTWISPLQREVRRFVGRKVGGEIVLKEENRGLSTEHWIFSKIKSNSFKWYARRQSRPDGPWKIFEEMTIVRAGTRPA